jgi:hypothetical protein
VDGAGARVSSQFLGPLRLEDVDGAEGILLEPLRFYSMQIGMIVVAPAGFKTDFASIPRGLWNILPKRGKHDKAAVLHDAGYRNQLEDVRGYQIQITKAQTDSLFLEAMEVSGVGMFSRRSMYLAVKFFGQKAYDEDREKARHA